METLIDCQIELLEIFMQQNYEVIVFSSNNLLEIDFLKRALRNELAKKKGKKFPDSQKIILSVGISDEFIVSINLIHF